MERRLVTIMAADVVGYSARMELSESETIRQLSAALADRLAREYPGFTIEKFIAGYPVNNPPALAAIRQGAKRAGLA